jgi:hypothetical protein
MGLPPLAASFIRNFELKFDLNRRKRGILFVSRQNAAPNFNGQASGSIRGSVFWDTSRGFFIVTKIVADKNS